MADAWTDSFGRYETGIRQQTSITNVSRAREDLLAARVLFERELALRRAVGEMAASVLISLGTINTNLGDTAAAHRYLEQAAPIAWAKDLGRVRYSLALLAEREGELEEARHLCALALREFGRLDMESEKEMCWKLLARIGPPTASEELE